MKCEIITIGTEILFGEIVNTNSVYLSRQLKKIGIDVSGHISISDDKEAIKNSVAAAIKRSDIIITTGGLGGTDDDITRESISELLNLPITRDQNLLDSIDDYFKTKSESIAESAKKEADIIQGAQILPNSAGLAPGQCISYNGKTIILLPGVPAELRAIYEDSVEKLLRKNGEYIHTEVVNIFGIAESALNDIIKTVDCENAIIGTYAKNGELTAEVTVASTDKDLAEEKSIQIADKIADAVGEYVYGRNYDSLATSVVAMLSEQKKVVTTAESCTGGLIAKQITDINGASAVFEQGVTAYANDIKRSALSVSNATLKKYGAVSPQTAADMAAGALFTSKADLAVSVTGCAGDNDPNKGLVYICLYDGKDCFVRKLHLSDSRYTRERIRQIASLHAFDMIRRKLSNLPVVNEKWMADGDSIMPDIKVGPFYVKQKKDSKNKLLSIFPKRYHFDPRRRGFDWTNLVRVVAFCLAFVVLTVSSAYILNDYMERKRNISASNTAREMYEDPSSYIENNDPSFIYTGPSDVLENFHVLYMQNDDIIGWIKITKSNGTNLIDYPVVQSQDNDFYLRRSFFGDYATGGTIFMDYRCNSTIFSKNTVIYGHNMKDNSMFAQLLKFNNASFYNSAPIIEYSTLYQKYKFKIFAAFYTNTKFNYIQVSFADRKEYLALIAEAQARSSINTNVDVGVDDSIITLSTCAYVDGVPDARFVVMGRLIRDGESENGCWATQNENALSIFDEYKPSDYNAN